MDIPAGPFFMFVGGGKILSVLGMWLAGGPLRSFFKFTIMLRSIVLLAAAAAASAFSVSPVRARAACACAPAHPPCARAARARGRPARARPPIPRAH